MTFKGVQNVPDYAFKYDWMVARFADGESWFYGAYPTKERAVEVAIEVNGFIVRI